MSDHVRDGRGPDRRERRRRDTDRDTHLLEQGVIAAALRWRNAQGGELDVVDTAERIDAARNLRAAVDNLEQFGGMDRLSMEDGATTVEWLLMAGIAALVVVPTSILGVGTWGRWFAVVAGLVACMVLLVRGERGRS